MLLNNTLCDVIIVAGGAGSRFVSTLPKQFELVHGRPLYLWSLDVFLNWPLRGALVLVVPGDWVEPVQESLKITGAERVSVVAGGHSRQASTHAGVTELAKRSQNQWVMIHDAARPLITQDLLVRLWQARRFDLTGSDIGGVIPGVPVRETIKRVERHLRASIVTETLARETLCVVQTPQLLKRDLLSKALIHFSDASATDDASLLEEAGHTIMVVDGDEQNIKVTYAEDKERVSHWLRNRHPPT